MLTREAILDAGVKVMNRVGPDSLTMRMLADELHVTPTAIYYYFGGREDILEAIVDRVCASIVAQVPSEAAWDARIRALMHAMVGDAMAHPSVAAWVISKYAKRPPVLRLHEAILEVLHEAGFSLESSVYIKGALMRLYTGHLVLHESAPGHEWRKLPRGAFPRYRASGPAIETIQEQDLFKRALDALLKGIERSDLSPDAHQRRPSVKAPARVRKAARTRTRPAGA